MATDLTVSEPAEPTNKSELVEDEEHWLYGDENSKNQTVNNETREKGAVLDGSTSVEHKSNAEQTVKSVEEEEEEDSDSDDDDVKVTIGNIKTGAPTYMGTGINLNIKPVRGYGVASANKLQSKGVDMESLGGLNGLHSVEAETDVFEDKPWRKPGADLSDYFNYGFNEETWKTYCEKQRRLLLGLEPCLPPSFPNKITVQQGRTVSLEKDAESSALKLDFKSDFSTQVLPATSRLKAGPPPNRKMAGTIDVIGGQTGPIRRVEGRRREMQEQNPIQVLGDHGNKTQPLTPPTGPPPLPIGVPPPHFLHRPPPVSGMLSHMQPPGIPPPALPGIFPPPLAPPPNLMMPPVNSRCPTSTYGNRAPPPFGYSSADPNYITYPPVSSAHVQWGSMMEKGAGGGCCGGAGHWDHQATRRERERDSDRDREQDRGERAATAGEYKCWNGLDTVRTNATATMLASVTAFNTRATAAEAEKSIQGETGATETRKKAANTSLPNESSMTTMATLATATGGTSTRRASVVKRSGARWRTWMGRRMTANTGTRRGGQAGECTGQPAA